MTALRFTADDAIAANDAWGANCGPGALAAILGMTLDEIRPHLGDFESKGYMNPTMMWAALKSARSPSTYRSSLDPLTWPSHGLARIQWDGPWCGPGRPARAAYRYTHWVAAITRDDPLSIGVFDINAIAAGGWIPLREWGEVLVPWLLKEVAPRASGRWWITHVYEVAPRHGRPGG